MKILNTHVAAGLFCILLFSFQLKATIFTYNATIDLSTPSGVYHQTGDTEYIWTISAAPTFPVQTGDVVQGTILFAGAEALQFAGPVNPAALMFDWLDFDGSNTSQESVLSTTTLNGLTGSDTLSNPTQTSSSGAGTGITPGFAFIRTATSVSFTGFSYSATMTSGSGNYTPYYLVANSPNDAPGAISVVPEPSVTGLIGMGLMFLCRKR